MHKRLNPGHEEFVDETAARAAEMDTEGQVAAARIAAREAAKAAAAASSTWPAATARP